eukprot:CAMPEP_0119026150 /NCGR_PEP_ID=MMETSP1176-20130426/34974_1 /TAXON_ID=265551 /ORGANISM="Synedropsis recta cf, Strain CCMP1620" /LENGTH=68 /DNA_ID=CAMNT_0006981817 /DNA_START=20 /DNA_END=222 /DNA_ORIENTATION=+
MTLLRRRLPGVGPLPLPLRAVAFLTLVVLFGVAGNDGGELDRDLDSMDPVDILLFCEELRLSMRRDSR